MLIVTMVELKPEDYFLSISLEITLKQFSVFLIVLQLFRLYLIPLAKSGVGRHECVI